MIRITPRIGLVVFLLFFLNSYGQSQTLDSLKLVLRNPKLHDTTKLYAISTTLDGYNMHSPEMNYLNNLMGKLAGKNYAKNQSPQLQKKYAMYLGAYYNNLGVLFGDKRNVVKALASYDQSIAYFKLAGAYNEMNYARVGKGIFLSKINENAKAISSLFTALRFYEKDKKAYEDGIAYVQSCLATIYESQGRHKESVFYNNKVIAYYANKSIKANDDFLRKGLAHINCGSSHIEMGDYVQAMAHFNQAMVAFKKINHATYMSITLTKMARVKMKERQFDQAETLLNQAMLGDIPEMATANAYVKMGELYYLKKELDKADHYLTQGFSMSRNVNNLELQEQASDLLFEVSTARKNFEKALEMHVFHDQLLDSSKTETSKNVLAQQQLKYDFEKKELNYKLATQKKTAAKNNWLIGLSGVLVLLTLGGYFYYRYSRQKQAITVLEKDQIKQKLLISQMNPHFIFNSIQNIRGLIHERQNDYAVDYLDKFSRLTRQILENSNETYISLEEEIEMTQNYLAIQQLLHHNKFGYSITVDENIEPESIFLPPMLTQPFIENAIKHGLAGKQSDGKVNIRFYLEDEKLWFEVTDNGSGFGSKNSDNHKSMAMAITKERLVHYTKNKDFIVHADNLSGADQKITGAKVAFEIPYIYEN